MSTWDVLKIFLILFVMMGLMYAILYFVKKYFYSYDRKSGSSGTIQVISTQAILPKKFVSVIRFNNAVYLLGVSEQSLNLIDKIEEYNIDKPIEKPINEKPNFFELLKRNMGFK